VFVVQTIPQLQEVVRERVQEVLAVGELSLEIQSALKETTEWKYGKIAGKDIRELISVYDIVGYQNNGSHRGAILSRKLRASF
jgi:hypothetical protein